MEARHRQQDSNVASCCGTVTSVLARQLGGPVRTVEKTAALRENQNDVGGGNDRDAVSSSLGSPVTDDLDSSDMASCRGAAAPPSANTVHCSELTVSNIRQEDGGWAARTDVTFRHRADRIFYVDSAARLHGPTDWRDRVRVAGIRRQEARRRQQQQQQKQQQLQQRQTRIVVQHRKQDSGLDTRLSDLERCLDQAMASIRQGRLLTTDGRSCAAGIGGGSSDSLAAPEDPRRRRRGNSEPPFEFACTQRTATFRPAEVYEEVEITTMRPIGRGIQDLGSASRFVFTSSPQLAATTCRRTATIAASTSTPGAVRRRLLLPTSPSSLRAEQSYQQHQHQQQRRRHQSAANVMEFNSQRYQRQQQLRQAQPTFWGGDGNGGVGGGGYWRR